MASETVDRAMSRVIVSMYERVGEELTVDDLARTAMYSKFHFSRIFRQATGVSPGRFLAALRFQEAKRLLASTSLSVAEISNRVGYSSLGTFSTRFKKFVGVTPTEYRRTGGRWVLSPRPESCRAVPDQGATGRLWGRVCAPPSVDCGQTFVGVFPDPVPHGAPLRSKMLARPGSFLFEDIPAGSWYLLVHGVVLDRPTMAVDAPGGPIGSVGRLGPVTVKAGADQGPADVELRPMRTIDLPVLSAPFTTRPGTIGRRPGALRPRAAHAPVSTLRPGGPFHQRPQSAA